MRLVVARCEVTYEGRLAAFLPMATRLIMVKADGCVAIHADGAYKPLNWMNAPNRLVEEEGRWVVEGSGGEQLTIVIEEVVSDSDHELGVDPGLEKDGVEAHLQLLAAQPGAIIPDLTLVRREYPTDIGPVDLLCRDPDGGAVAIEVKRRARDRRRGAARPLRGAPEPRPPTASRAGRARRPGGQAAGAGAGRRPGLGLVEVDYDALRGIESSELRLF